MKSLIINNLEFTTSQQALNGVLEASACSRLVDLLADAKRCNIQYKLIGHAKRLSMPSLQLNIHAVLQVTCQRCLQAMPIDLMLNFDYLIGDEMPSENDELDDTDWLEAAADMDLGELIEDELLLAMPIAPMHTSNCQLLKSESGEKPNPFAILKGKIQSKQD
jgi:uncharacterized protein